MKKVMTVVVLILTLFVSTVMIGSVSSQCDIEIIPSAYAVSYPIVAEGIDEATNTYWIIYRVGAVLIMHTQELQ